MRQKMDTPGQLDLNILPKKKPQEFPEPVPPPFPGKRKKEVSLPENLDPQTKRWISEQEENQKEATETGSHGLR